MRVVEPRRYIFGLTGYPLGHSMSPVIHKALFEISGIDASYVMVETPPEELGDSFRKSLSAMRGFNVTIPHKINIIRYLDELSPRLSFSVPLIPLMSERIILWVTIRIVPDFCLLFKWLILNLAEMCFFSEAAALPV